MERIQSSEFWRLEGKIGNVTACAWKPVCLEPAVSGCQPGLLGRKEILQDGASFVHLLWHFNLKKKPRKDLLMLRLMDAEDLIFI